MKRASEGMAGNITSMAFAIQDCQSLAMHARKVHTERIGKVNVEMDVGSICRKRRLAHLLELYNTGRLG
jgi:hypothetical protein